MSESPRPRSWMPFALLGGIFTVLATLAAVVATVLNVRLYSGFRLEPPPQDQEEFYQELWRMEAAVQLLSGLVSPLLTIAALGGVAAVAVLALRWERSRSAEDLTEHPDAPKVSITDS